MRDGNHCAATEPRLKDLRGLSAAPLPGQALVVVAPQRLLSTAVIPREEGHAPERSLLPAGLQRVEAGQLWSEERHCCPLGLLGGMHRRGAAFLVRQHGQLHGELLGPAQRLGTTRRGPVYAQAMQGRDPATGETLRLRRLTIELKVATRDGDTALHILSNVPPERGAAAHLARVYGKRWSIETAFLEITTTLACEINTLGYPKAAIFGFCLALVAYNMLAVVLAALRSVHGAETVAQEVSSYYIAHEIAETSRGMMIALPEDAWRVFRTMSAAAMGATLLELARKAPR